VTCGKIPKVSSVTIGKIPKDTKIIKQQKDKKRMDEK